MQQLLQIATVHYPIHEKLIKLINSIGYQWAENIELKKEIQKVSTNSSTCKIFKKLSKNPLLACLWQPASRKLLK